MFVYSWEEVEKEAGVQLVYKTGGVNWAKKAEMGHLIDKYAVAMDANNIRYKTSLKTNQKPKLWSTKYQITEIISFEYLVYLFSMERDFANQPLKQRLQKEKKGPHTRLGHSEKSLF